MTRFEIQEMVSQTEGGITFLAVDKQSQRQVELRRFFPHGPGGGGLSAEECETYCETCRRLTGITHSGLRTLIDGGIDPTDNMPYLVTEWIEGYALADILGGQSMDVGRALDVVRIALEVSLALSEVFGEQAVWVETDPSSIVVDVREGARGYTFRVCPVCWFGSEPKLREVRTLAQLAERLIGWDRRIYSDTSGGGFGGWVKTMKASPQISLESALEQLATSIQPVPTESVGQEEAPVPPASPAQERAATRATAPRLAPVAGTSASGHQALRVGHQALRTPPPPAQPDFSSPQGAGFCALSPRPTPPGSTPANPTHQKTQSGNQAVLTSASKASSSRVSMVIIGVFLVAVAVLIFVIYSKRPAAAGLASQEASELALPGAPSPGDTAQARGGQNPDRAQDSDPSAAAEGPEAAPGPHSAEVPLFSHTDSEGIQKLADGARLRVRGTLRAMTVASKSGNVVLHFSKPPVPGQIRAVAFKRNFESTPEARMFHSLLGKEVVIEGVLRKTYNPKLALRISFQRMSQISPADKAGTPQSPGGEERLPLTPRDYESIAEMPSDQPVLLQGVVKAVWIPADADCMRISFAGPADTQQIEVVACPGTFDNRRVSADEFPAIVEDLQHLVNQTIQVHGVVSRLPGQTQAHVVRISGLNQIAVEK